MISFRSRTGRTTIQVVLSIVTVIIYAALIDRVAAESALPLLSGFDIERIDAAYPADSEESVGELGKLIYRLRNLDAENLSAKAAVLADQPEPELGDLFTIDGNIESIRVMRVPQRLVEFLELESLQEIVLSVDDRRLRVVTTKFPREAKRGDRASGTGVLIEKGTIGNGTVDEGTVDEDSADDPPVLATARLSWFPKSPVNAGWKMLGDHGVDVSKLAELGTRNRRPLAAEDGDAFYSMLAAAERIGQNTPAVTPSVVEPVSLLREPETFTGQWVRMTLETVQITRVSVTEPIRQQQLGSDHYFQIDAVGDLGNVVVQIEPPAGTDGETVLFENRYPVSLVMKQLPDFLRDEIRAQGGGAAVVSEVSVLVSVDAFFFRLWSYSTDYMQQHGGGDQFGPLLVAAGMTSRQGTGEDPAGVATIGWIAAIAVFTAILAIWSWHRRVTRADESIRQERKERESDQIDLPTDA